MQRRSAIFWGAVVATVLALPCTVQAQTNLALGKPMTASPSSQFPPAEAVDGNLGTRWASAQGVDPQWIYVDLGAPAAIGSVVLRWEAAYAKAYQIQTSNDAATWTSIYSTTAGAGGTQALTVAGSGRYVRMYGTVRGSIYGYSLWEMEVFGSSGATATATTRATATATARPTATTRATATSTARSTATSTATARSTPAPGGNIAQGRPATASTTQVGYATSAAVDGNTGTRWASDGGIDPQWIYVDLGATASIARVRLSWEVAYGKAYQIQTSNDAASWTSIYSTTTGDGAINDLAVSGSGRYVRMYGTARGTAFGYSLWELEVYSTGSTPTATSRPTPTSAATATATTPATATATTRSTATATATTARATPTSPSSCSTMPNIALNKPAYTWYYQDSAREPKYAVNGDRTGGAADNRWATPWMPTAWIYINLGATATISRVELYWEAAYATAYEIQVSGNASTWTTVRSVTGNASTTNILTFSPTVSGRYVRMNGITRATTFGYSLYEFEIYGCGDNPGVTPAPPPTPLPGSYVLNWSDEFDGTALDMNKWAYDPGAPANNEAETYTTDSQNIRVGGGVLTLEAHDTQDNGQACNGCRFTSGRIKTLGKKSIKYGRLAARMQLPVAPGMWPAFWGLGVDLGSVGWPTCGEINVMENIGYSDWISGALHGPGYFGAGSVGGRINMPSTIANFHEYRVDWDPTYVQWYVDGALMLTANRADVVATRGQWVYEHDFYLILNLAMGGDYPAGYNGASTPFFGLPQATVDMLPLRANVDYVRVYQKQ